MDAQEVINLLHDRAEDFCRWLLPQGKRNGAFWEVGNIRGEPGDSLRIHVEGEMVGVWADHGAGESMKGATLVHLLMQHRGTTNWGKSLVQVKEWLGLDITADEDRVFRQPLRNGGKFETAAKHFVKLNPDGPVFRYLVEQRGLSPAILEQYRVMEHRDQAAMCFAQATETGKGVAFTKYVAVQRNGDGSKKEWSDPKGANPGLWGKYAVAEEYDEIVITEGEIDAMSVAEASFAAVSMPNGAKNDKWIERDWRWLERFRSIILCFDADDAGADGLDRAFPKLVARLGRYRCRIARMPDGVKDPNEAIQKGMLNELVQALKDAASIDPQPLKNYEEYREKVAEIFFPTDDAPLGFKTPWTDRLRFRPAEFTIWTGFSGHGKSTALMHCIADLAMIHEQRAIVASMESPVHKTAAILCRQVAGREIKTREHFDRVYNRVAENVWAYDYLGSAPWADLIETFRYAWRRYGVSQFVIDSLMTCDIDTDDYNAQSKFIGALCQFADESQGHIHVVAHSKKRTSEDDAPGKMDVAGHANLTNRAFNGLTVFRNKAKIESLKDAEALGDKKAISEALIEHDAELHCWKQRETGEEFAIELWLHRNSLQFWPEKSPGGRPYLPNQAPNSNRE